MKGFKKGDPRAVRAAKKGAKASKRTRRALMLERFIKRCRSGMDPFRAFLEGWRAHREWSSRRRDQLRRLTAEGGAMAQSANSPIRHDEAKMLLERLG